MIALHKFAENTPRVIYVPGNHEYYGQDMVAFDLEILRRTRGTNIEFLNPGAIVIGDVTFIGAALWTNFRGDPFKAQLCARMISDFSLIKKFGTGKCAKLNETHTAYIKDKVAATEGKKVVVTHFLPAVECIDAQYANEGTINTYFANDMKKWIYGLENTTWIHGHTHANVDITLGMTRIIANPYGYNKNNKFKEVIIDV
jgi:UDP-2,3-diacylglucosamine pyrophosphatase LpxH